MVRWDGERPRDRRLWLRYNGFNLSLSLIRADIRGTSHVFGYFTLLHPWVMLHRIHGWLSLIKHLSSCLWRHAISWWCLVKEERKMLRVAKLPWNRFYNDKKDRTLVCHYFCQRYPKHLLLGSCFLLIGINLNAYRSSSVTRKLVLTKCTLCFLPAFSFIGSAMVESQRQLRYLYIWSLMIQWQWTTQK
jgi:hypothetical protein